MHSLQRKIEILLRRFLVRGREARVLAAGLPARGSWYFCVVVALRGRVDGGGAWRWSAEGLLVREVVSRGTVPFSGTTIDRVVRERAHRRHFRCLYLG